MSGLANINPNQFAIPGLEKDAHAGARHLAEGYRFTFKKRGTDGYGKPYKGDRHKMEADTGVSEASHLTWSGKDDTGAEYPGEIRYVETEDLHKGRGLAAAMFKMANTLNMGQSTIPVHSPDRTNDGYRWSQKVGGYGVDSGYDDGYGGRGPHPIKGSDEYGPAYDSHGPKSYGDALEAPHPFKTAEPQPAPRQEVPGQMSMLSTRQMSKLRRPPR